MSQIAGQPCVICHEDLLLEREGILCSGCGSVICCECCEENGQCPVCASEIPGDSQPAGEPDSDPESAFPEPPPDEPHLTVHGATITETEYRLAIRHHRLAWIFMLSAGIPLACVIAVISSFTIRRVMYAIPLVLAPLHPIAMKLFPGARKHGTVVFRKYQVRRGAITSKYEKRRRNLFE